MRNTIVLLVGLLLWGCGPRKEMSPEWVMSKPIDPSRTYVYGVGMSYVNPNTSYQQAARSNALADLAGEVESQVFDESRLLQKEDVGGFTSAFSSQTMTKSHIKLEGYELVSTWSDDVRFYALYKLDLPKFLKLKAENDRLAMDWIKTRLATAKDQEATATERFQNLADAIQKALDRQFFTDPEYKIEINAELIASLRSIEDNLEGSLFIPESLYYLGIPQLFKGRVVMEDENVFHALELQSNAGAFHFSSTDQTVICEHTGTENSVNLVCTIDYKKLLPNAGKSVTLWLKEKSAWKISESLYFQNTALKVLAQKSLKNQIEQSLSLKFDIIEEAPLVLQFTGKDFQAPSGSGRTKYTITGNFILRESSTNNVLWSGGKISKYGISTNIRAAKEAAYEDFDEDIRFLIIPQILRNLGY